MSTRLCSRLTAVFLMMVVSAQMSARVAFGGDQDCPLFPVDYVYDNGNPVGYVYYCDHNFFDGTECHWLDTSFIPEVQNTFGDPRDPYTTCEDDCIPGSSKYRDYVFPGYRANAKINFKDPFPFNVDKKFPHHGKPAEEFQATPVQHLQNAKKRVIASGGRWYKVFQITLRKPDDYKDHEFYGHRDSWQIAIECTEPTGGSAASYTVETDWTPEEADPRHPNDPGYRRTGRRTTGEKMTLLKWDDPQSRAAVPVAGGKAPVAKPTVHGDHTEAVASKFGGTPPLKGFVHQIEVDSTTVEAPWTAFIYVRKKDGHYEYNTKVAVYDEKIQSVLQMASLKACLVQVEIAKEPSGWLRVTRVTVLDEDYMLKFYGIVKPGKFGDKHGH